MTVQITVVGLHRIGVSIGLALQKVSDKVLLVGFDEDADQAGRVGKLKAFSRIERELPAAVKDADLVIMAVPAAAVDEYLHLLANHLKENGQVIDTSPLHVGMDALASGIIRPDCAFISATPVLNLLSLALTSESDDEPRADLFARGALLICKGPKTAPDMIKVAADLAQLLGTQAYFTDPLEADVLLSEVDLLPKLAAVALMNTAATNPGWNESRRVAGGTLSEATALLAQENVSEELTKIALQSRETTLRALDRYASRIAEIRTAVEKNNEADLKELLSAAQSSREDWLAFKQKFDWSTPDGKSELSKRDSPGGLLFQRLIHRKK